MITWRALAREKLKGAPRNKEWPDPAGFSSICLTQKDSTLVFVDGFYMPAKIENAICLDLDQALKSYGLFLQNRWNKTFREKLDPYYLWNAAEHGRGLFLYIPPETNVSLNVIHHSTNTNLASPKIQIVLGKNASLTLLQTVQGGACNGVIDASLEAGSNLKFYDLSLLPSDASISMSFCAELKQDASCEVFHATDGAKKMRFSASATLLEPNSSFLFRSLGMLRQDRQAEIYALADHAAPHCTSRQHVKTVLNGESKSSFEGKIYVRPIAQKTMAYQLNNNLILSNSSIAKSKPNLEIFADDVKASHGATFSQLSDEPLFYLRSRGLSLLEARSLLMKAFCREIIDSLEMEALKQPLLEAMARVYAQ
jgi:Fe-S cluster assembly protein SufD